MARAGPMRGAMRASPATRAAEGLESLVEKSLLRQADPARTASPGSSWRWCASTPSSPRRRRRSGGRAAGATPRTTWPWPRPPSRSCGGAAQVAWRDTLAREHDNLRQALRWLAEHGPAADGLRLGAAVWRFWELRGHTTEGLEWLSRLLASPAPTVGSGRAGEADRRARAKALCAAAALAVARDDHGLARTHFEAGLRLWQELGDRAGMATALHGLGDVARYLDGEHIEGARGLHEQALAIRRELGDRAGRRRVALQPRGDARLLRGRVRPRPGPPAGEPGHPARARRPAGRRLVAAHPGRAGPAPGGRRRGAADLRGGAGRPGGARRRAGRRLLAGAPLPAGAPTGRPRPGRVRRRPRSGPRPPVHRSLGRRLPARRAGGRCARPGAGGPGGAPRRRRRPAARGHADRHPAPGAGRARTSGGPRPRRPRPGGGRRGLGRGAGALPGGGHRRGPVGRRPLHRTPAGGPGAGACRRGTPARPAG